MPSPDLPWRYARLVWLYAGLLTVLAGTTPPAYAGTPAARNSLLALLPAESGQITFLDAEELRRSPHYAEIKALLLPSSMQQFQRYLAWIGIDLDRDVQRLLLAVSAQANAADEIVGLAEGEFHAERARRFFEQQHLPLAEYDGETLFPFGSGSGRDELVFAFLDDATAAFGTRQAVEKLLDIRRNLRPGLERNETMLRLVREVNGKAHNWIVMNSAFARRGLSLLLPSSATFAEFRRAAQRIDAATLQLEVGQNLESFFVAHCRTALDSHLFSAVLQVVLLAERWKYKNEKPALATAIENTAVNATGPRLEVTTRVDEPTLAQVLKARLAEGGR